jgi:hypothetical protein
MMAISDRDLIDQAYEALVKSAFGVFHTGRTTTLTGKEPKTAEAEAENLFQRQIAALKASRDRAQQLLAGGNPPIA